MSCLKRLLQSALFSRSAMDQLTFHGCAYGKYEFAQPHSREGAKATIQRKRINCKKSSIECLKETSRPFTRYQIRVPNESSCAVPQCEFQETSLHLTFRFPRDHDSSTRGPIHSAVPPFGTTSNRQLQEEGRYHGFGSYSSHFRA
jgi:hypothetical protein